MSFTSIKEMNRLLSKGMSNIYLKITSEKTWCSQNFGFLILKICHQVRCCGAQTHADTMEF